MELTTLSKLELLAKCEELGLTKYKSKNKNDLINLINSKTNSKKTNIELIITDVEENIILYLL